MKEAGRVKKYEPFFNTRGVTGIVITFEAIYEGEVRNNRFNGIGRYDYYTKAAPFKNNVTSSELQTEGLNFDSNARYINEMLLKNNISSDVRAYFEGEFKNGLVKKGTIYYKVHPDSDFVELMNVDKK